jgi:hypothetical protein
MGFSVELPIKAKQRGLTIMEVPVTVTYTNKIKFFNSLKHGLAVLFAVFKHWWYKW